MKRLLLIGLFLIGCSDNFEPAPDCGDCGMDIYASGLEEISDGYYKMEYDTSLAQTYTRLRCYTDCGWSKSVGWGTNYMYQVVPNQWIDLINPGSMTDDEGHANVMFAVWEPFIGYTVTVYGGYTDECGVQHVDSIKVLIVDEE